MDMLFNALQKGVPMASQCMQLNFGGGEVVSTQPGSLCLKKKGGERGKMTSPLRQKMDMQTCQK